MSLVISSSQMWSLCLFAVNLGVFIGWLRPLHEVFERLSRTGRLSESSQRYLAKREHLLVPCCFGVFVALLIWFVIAFSTLNFRLDIMVEKQTLQQLLELGNVAVQAVTVAITGSFFLSLKIFERRERFRVIVLYQLEEPFAGAEELLLFEQRQLMGATVPAPIHNIAINFLLAKRVYFRPQSQWKEYSSQVVLRGIESGLIRTREDLLGMQQQQLRGCDATARSRF